MKEVHLIYCMRMVVTILGINTKLVTLSDNEEENVETVHMTLHIHIHVHVQYMQILKLVKISSKQMKTRNIAIIATVHAHEFKYNMYTLFPKRIIIIIIIIIF